MKFTILLEIDADSRRDAEKAAEGIADGNEAVVVIVARTEHLLAEESIG
jgi:hypothetical protein